MPPPKPEDARTFLRLAIEPDGRIAVGFKGEVASRAEEIPAPEGPGKVWLTIQSAPTNAAVRQLATVSEIADARGWFLVARILPEHSAPGARAKPPKLIEAQVIPDGSVVVDGFSAPPDAVRTLLPSGGCSGESIALTSAGAARHQLFTAAERLAAAGCEVMLVRRPPGT